MEIRIDRVRHFANPKAFRRGTQHYQQNRVVLKTIEDDSFEANVIADGCSYHVIGKKKDQRILAGCSCGYSYWGSCEHVVATLLTAHDYYEQDRPITVESKIRPNWQDFFKKISEKKKLYPSAQKLRPQWRVVYRLSLHDEYWTIAPRKAYLRKDGQLGRLIPVSNLDPDSTEIQYTPNDPFILTYLAQSEHSYASNSSYRPFVYTDYPAYHFRYGCKIGRLFDLLRDSTILLGKSDSSVAPISLLLACNRVEFQITGEEDSFRFTPFIVFNDKKEPLDERFRVLAEKPAWVFYDNSIFQVDGLESTELVLPFTQNPLSVLIPKSEFPQFIENVFPRLSSASSLRLPDNLPVQVVSQISKKRVYLQEGTNQLQVFLRLLYDEFEIDFHEPLAEIFRMASDGQTIIKIQRDMETENQLWQQVLYTGVKSRPLGGARISDAKALPWMFENIPQFFQAGFEIFGRENLRKYKVRTGSPNVKIAVSSEIDWFDLNLEIDIEGVLLSIKELKKALSHRQRYVKLADGSIGKLTEEWFKKFQHLFNFADVKADAIHVPRFHVTLIDVLFEEAISRQADEQYHQSLALLQQFNGVQSQPLPANMENVLRPYQKAGYDWLYFLHDYSFGGCLADDMGLGKTLQALTLLLKEKENGNTTPSLIVCPTSVVFNWEKEVQKFTSDLRVLIHAGMDRDRHTEDFAGFDIILTSYGLLRRDIVFLKDFKFHYVILDESQKIKNPLSQTAKAARVLQAQHRLVLTGTPVENNTVELWSQFSFLNHGLLGSLNYFREYFTNPIEKKKDEEAATFLKKLIFPFVMRRTKERVAPELPEKVEQFYYCGMNPEQERLYKHWRDFYRAMILSKIDEVGLNKSRMNILEGLVKLRQIACHPYLVDQNVEEDSAKFESLKELMESILAENHKVLVFSQFVKMLTLIRKHLDANGITYEYLDGHTVDRESAVNRFQTEEEIRVFLISLKAGGTGLNLTAADYVILYDPWWNPAVEIQAADRAHRIGQDKKVFVYRLITKASVEEKMLDLQEKKKNLVSTLISTDGGFFKTLSREDIEVLFS